jgi:hypothetical protein
MANFDINTRADLVKRRSISVSSGTFETGRWLTIDANGFAAKPSAGSPNVYMTILGNEVRPDSIGSSSVTVQYGENLYTLNTYGANDTISVGSWLQVNTYGDLVVTTGFSGNVVAIAENAKNQGVTGLKIRVLR